MSNFAAHVLPHGPLTQLGPRLWQVTGSLPHIALPRNMLVHRMASGCLWLHSVIALDEPTMGELLALGEPDVMVVPNGAHRLDAEVYKRRFSDLKVLCPAAARGRVERIVRVDATCEEALAPLGVIPHAMSGLKPGELCYELDAGDGRALVVTDVLFNLPRQHGLSGWVMNAIGSTGFFGITRIGRMLVLKDREAFRRWLLEMASVPELRIVCVAHGDAIVGDAAARLREAAARL